MGHMRSCGDSSLLFSNWGLAGFAMFAQINAGNAYGVFRKIQPEESGAAQADTASEEEEL